MYLTKIWGGDHEHAECMTSKVTKAAGEYTAELGRAIIAAGMHELAFRASDLVSSLHKDDCSYDLPPDQCNKCSEAFMLDPSRLEASMMHPTDELNPGATPGYYARRIPAVYDDSYNLVSFQGDWYDDANCSWADFGDTVIQPGDAMLVLGIRPGDE